MPELRHDGTQSTQRRRPFHQRALRVRVSAVIVIVNADAREGRLESA